MSRISSFTAKAEKEYKKYKSTGDGDYLAQAGEKLWNVFNLIVQEKIGRKVRNYGELKKAVSELYVKTGSNLLLQTMKNAYDLHKYFYRGWTEAIGEIEELYLEVKQSLLILEGSL